MSDFNVGFFVGFAFAIMLIVAAFAASTTQEKQFPEAISFTTIDKDITDSTIYTTDGEILTTNKYLWMRIELNKSYVCDKGFINHISNCHEVGRDVP